MNLLLHGANVKINVYSSSLCLMLSSNTILWLLYSDGYLSINTLLWLLHSDGDGYVNSDISTTL